MTKRSDRSAEYAWDDRDPDFHARAGATPGSLPIRAAELAMRNPVTTGGVAVSLLMVAVTIANAVANQPARHPHPLFDTRSAAQSEQAPVQRTPAKPAAPSKIETPTGSTVPLAMPRPRPVSAVEEGLVRDLQVVLAERGFYSGPIDGVIGPATAEAIRAGERRLGTTPTGEASELLLAALKAAPSVVAQAQQPPAQPATKPAAAQARTSTPAASTIPSRAVTATASAPPISTPPTPSMRVATADAVAFPVGRDEAGAAEVDMPVFTGSIRRAAREPLASGGDERLQKLQRALIAAGYGPLKADGKWDERSTSAVRRYEADRGWPVTGRPSEKLVWDLMPRAAEARR